MSAEYKNNYYSLSELECQFLIGIIYSSLYNDFYYDQGISTDEDEYQTAFTWHISNFINMSRPAQRRRWMAERKMLEKLTDLSF